MLIGRNSKLVVLLISAVLWFLVSIARTPDATGDYKQMNLDSSWAIGLAASLHAGALAGRDFQFTYGPASQVIASVGAWFNVDDSAYPALPLIILCFWSYSILLFALFVALNDDVDWKATLLVCIAGSILNLFSEPTSFRNLILLVCVVLFYRAAVVRSRTTSLILASLTGIVAVWAQLTSLELALYALATIAGTAGVLVLLTRLRGFDRGLAMRYAAIGITALGSLALGNLLLSVFFRLSSHDYGSYAGLFEYQRLSWETIRGYNLTTGAPWTLDKFQTIGLAAVLTYTLIIALLRLRTANERRLAWMVPLMLFSIIVMKSAFLRSDVGHITVASSPFVLLFLLLGRDELTRWRSALIWIGFAGILFWVWPWSGPYAFNDLRGLVAGRTHPWQKLIGLRNMRVPPDSLPDGLKPALEKDGLPVLNFPYEIYMGSTLNRLFVAPTLQAHAAQTPDLQKYYVTSMLKRRVAPTVVYGMDDIASARIDSVQFVTRSPIVFQYIYEHFEPQEPRKYGPGFYLLKQRNAPASMNFSRLSTEVTANDAGIEIHSENEVSCPIVRLDMQIRYPRTMVLGRPAAALVTFLLSGQPVQSSRLVALDNGRRFQTLISLVSPMDFVRVFTDSEMPSLKWDTIHIGYPIADLLDTAPAETKVLSVDCATRN